MKIDPKDIARALVDVASDPQNTDLTAEIDEAIKLLKRDNPGKSIRTFPTLVERALRRAGLDIQVILITPTGDAGAVAKDIADELTRILKRTVHLVQKADSKMIGGAVLIVGDERFDVSIPGALSHLREYLRDAPVLSKTH